MMKTFRILGMALVAVMLGFAMSACSDDDDDYLKELEKEYSRLIVGKWFNFTPEASMFLNYQADNTYNIVGWDKEFGWLEMSGTYRLEGNKLIESYTWTDGSQLQTPQLIEIKDGKLVFLSNLDMPEVGEKINYRVQESFDITGKYSYLNSAVRVVAATGKTEMKLPEGITFGGKNTIPVDALHGDRIVEQMKKFFADATFAADGKLNHTLDGEAKVKNYTLDGNNLVFNLYEGSELYKVNATTFPDEDGDRLFIIIPKQAAWMGGFVELIEKENTGLKMTEAQIKELETEFLTTFDTFTVILSLSKK